MPTLYGVFYWLKAAARVALGQLINIHDRMRWPCLFGVVMNKVYF